MTQDDSRLEMALKVLKDNLKIPLEYTKIQNFRFCLHGKTKKIVHDSVVTDSHL